MDVTAMHFTHTTSVVSRKQFDDHITLYNGYVNMTNLTDKTLAAQPEYATANASGGYYRGWKKSETYAINGIILHELYFQNLGNETAPPGQKMQRLAEKYYGGMDKWKEDFTACATSARGWCIFAYEQRTATCRNILLDVHDEGQIATAFPIIILDMYEHAYFLDYGTDKAAYIKRFLDNIPWDVIEKRAGIVV
ncbi:MAG: Fe-Mn family superoxide dismutase [Defluviitaleaceae bacterium]|nr:Fe-Mn family superoxide dismutase [Defluviitaleaceae bacterium]MCL2263486.1 Fe-Mn family superoxide dismutase [Defluviitaleaceae bacterium]